MAGPQPTPPSARSRVAGTEGGGARFTVLIGEASERHEVPDPLLREVIRAESDFVP
ncbi:hypothetical protein [Thiohalorhabdus sp.]|uniref:hypothetical protein n=1 Tax=Thiohalorhabdus sp. TaxID=3094134 RepID=UPI002FC34A33